MNCIYVLAQWMRTFYSYTNWWVQCYCLHLECVSCITDVRRLQWHSLRFSWGMQCWILNEWRARCTGQVYGWLPLVGWNSNNLLLSRFTRSIWATENYLLKMFAINKKISMLVYYFIPIEINNIGQDIFFFKINKTNFLENATLNLPRRFPLSFSTIFINITSSVFVWTLHYR